MIDGLPPEAQTIINRALQSGTVATTAIVTVLTSHGLDARAENVGRHRRRLQGGNYACTCPVPSEATP